MTRNTQSRNFLGGCLRSPLVGSTTHRLSTRPSVLMKPLTLPSAYSETVSPMCRKLLLSHASSISRAHFYSLWRRGLIFSGYYVVVVVVVVVWVRPGNVTALFCFREALVVVRFGCFNLTSTTTTTTTQKTSKIQCKRSI